MANDMEPGVRAKAPFYVVLVLVVLGLGGFALYRAGILFPKGNEGGTGGGTGGNGAATPTKVEDPTDPKSVVTAKDYNFVPESTLPPVKGVSSYAKLDKDNPVVKMALNVWAGWAPIAFANQGFKPNKVWTTPKGRKFKLELVLIDDPIAMRDAYASGNVHIGWATVDMLPLFMEELRRDSRTMPRVYQQVDWSNGGDGIVSRDEIQNVGQLRGKTVVLAQNSPSQYFVLNSLINAGVQPGEVTFKYTSDAFQAATAYASDKKIAAAVSWAPDIYKLADLKGNKLLVTTADANHLIADVYFPRADFAKDNPDIVEALVRGFLDSVDDLDSSKENREQAAKLLAVGYNMPPDDALKMLGDAHWTNYAENREFFMNQNSPTNFERTWDNAYVIYKGAGKVTEKTPWNQVADFSIIQRLSKEPKYANSINKYQVQFTAKSASVTQVESKEILTKTVVIHFFPNSADLDHKILKTDANGKTAEELYDPNVKPVVEEIGKMAGQFGAARIVIEGHTDASMKGSVPFDAVKELSEQRARSVRNALLQKFPSVNPNQIAAAGMGWNVPADPNDPDNHAKNRRVEVKVYPLEAKQ